MIKRDINDAISLQHTLVRLENNRIWIKDCDSTFGTSKKVRFPCKILKTKNKYSFQVNNTILTLFYGKKGFDQKNLESTQ